MLAEQLMSRPVHTCLAGDTLDAAARLMWDHDCGSVPVVDDAGVPIGMITDRDITMAAYTQGKPLASISIESAMARDVFTCAPSTSIDVAEAVMASKQVRRLPVVENGGRVIGLLSVNDIAREAARSRKSNGAHREVVETLASICEPRHTQLRPAEKPAPRRDRA